MPIFSSGGGGGGVSNPVGTGQGGLGVNNGAATGIPQFSAGVATVTSLPLTSGNLTGVLALAHGGAGSDLSITGSATQDQFLHQNGSGANVTVAALSANNVRDGYLDNTNLFWSDDFDAPMLSTPANGASGNQFSASGGWICQQAATAGTSSGPNAIAGHPGIHLLGVSTSASSGIKYRRAHGYVSGTGTLQMDTYMMWANGPDATDDFVLWSGFSDDGTAFTPATVGNSVIVGVQRATDTTHFVVVSVVGGVVKQNTASTTTWTAGTWYVLRVVITATGAANVSVGTTQSGLTLLSNGTISAANAPATGTQLFPQFLIQRVGGSTNARTVNIDRCDFSNAGLTAR
jgi:hypothetical protein